MVPNLKQRRPETKRELRHTALAKKLPYRPQRQAIDKIRAIYIRALRIANITFGSRRLGCRDEAPNGMTSKITLRMADTSNNIDALR